MAQKLEKKFVFEEKLMELFFRKDFSGSGLTLSICLGLQMEGRRH